MKLTPGRLWMAFAATGMLFGSVGMPLANADLIFAPGATLITSGGDEGAGSVANIGFNFVFYTNTYTALSYVQNNGFIELGSAQNNSYNNTALGSMSASSWPPFIAALWDDLNGDSGIYGGQSNNSYTITWSLTHSYSTSAYKHRFQISLFGGTNDQTFAQTNDSTKVFVFKPGDIAISYAYVSQGSANGTFEGGNATVGILDGKNGNANGTGNYRSLPGRTDGLVANADIGLLPTNSGSFILFRPDTTGTNYTSVVTNFAQPSGVPPSITVLAATNVQATTAALNGNLGADGGSATTVLLYWGPTDGGTNNPAAWTNTVQFGQVAVGTVSTNLTGLTPATTYYYRFFASNVYGVAWAPATTNFTTFAAPTVNNASGANSIGTGTATLNGTLLTQTGQVVICWGTADGGNTTTSAWQRVAAFGAKTAGNSVSTNLTGLLYGQRYYYRTYATNDWGEGWAPSTTNFLTTMSGVGISNGTVSGLTMTSGVLNATLQASGSVFDVYAYWNTSDGGTNAANWTNSAYVGTYTNVVSTNVSCAATGLTRAVTYFFTFRASNAATDSWASSSMTFTTPSGAPTGATLAATAIGPYGATLNGSVDSVGAATTSVFFLWGTADGSTNLSQWANTNVAGVVGGTGVVSSVVAGLTANTTYYYVLYVTNSYGSAFGAPSRSFSTLPPPPPLVADYQFNGNLQSSVAGAPDLVFPGQGGGGSGTTPYGYTNDASIGRQAFYFPAASGLTFPTTNTLGTIYSTNYTVGVLFRGQATIGNGWYSLIDPSGGSFDKHTYIYNNQARVEVVGGGSFASVTGTSWYQLFISIGPTSDIVNAACAQVTGGPLINTFYTFTPTGTDGLSVKTDNNKINFFRDDIFNADPFPAGEVARIQVYQGAMTTNYMATLNLAVVPPACTTAVATALAPSSATLNGNIVSTGGGTTSGYFLWDIVDRGTNLTQWAHTNALGLVGTGAVSTNLTGLTAGNTYYYILYASNSAGQSFGTNAVSFTTPAPPVATTVAASAQTLNSATLNGSVSTGTAPTTVAFLWDTTDHVGNPTQWAHTTTPMVVSAGAVASNLTGLSSSTTYYYILYATNQYGTSYGTNSDGTAHSFVTLTPTLGPSVSTAPASGQTPYAATLNGSVGSTGSAVTTVFFLYDTTDRGASQGGWAHTTTPVVVSGLGPVSASVSGLTPATTYYCLLYGTNTDGESFGTNAVAFSTLGLAPSVDTTAASGLTASGATLHGDVISTGTAPTIAYFLYDIANHGTNFALWPYSTAPLAVTGGQSLSTNLSGLPLATTYYFVLYASNSVGTAFGTPVQNFTTLALPPTIDALAATNIWSSSAAMNGNLAATNGAATTVSLYWGTNDAGAAAQGWLHTNAFGQQSAGALSTNITGLTPLTTYWYRYFATNSVGGAWSTGTTFRTAPGLIFDRASTQVVNGGDDNIAAVTLPFTFTLFNVTTNRLRIGSNGACSPKDSEPGLAGGDYFSATWYSKGYPALAILWNDMNTSPGDAPAINGTYGDVASVAGVTYTNTYAVTVPHVYTYRTGYSSLYTEIAFQMTLFGTNVTVRLASGNIFAFRSGDIMYCYADNRLTAFAGGSCAIGVADGAGNYVGMPGTTSGALSSANRGLLPTTNAETFVLFRPDATGTNYTSVITNFYIEPIAPTCTTAVATSLTTSSATLNGSVTSTGNAPTSVYFLWGATDRGTNVALWAHTNALGVAPGPGAVSTNLTGLTSGATYYYIVYAVSSAGASYGLPAQSFTVPAPPVATTLAASAVTVASATLNGNVTTGTAPTTVWFLWDTTDRGPDRTAWAHTNVLGVVGAGGVSTNLGSLAAQSTYAFLVYATNAYGESYGTPAQSFTTLTLSTNPSVSTASATGITPYSAVLQGSVGSTGVSPTTVFFLWDTTEHGASWSAWPHATEAVITGEGAYSTNLTSLSPATTYYYLFYGSNTASESYGTNAVSFTTLGLPPTAATLAADGVSTSAATLHGTVTTGTAPTTVYFLWGSVNQGTNLGLWAHSTPPASGVSAGPVSANVSGLSLGATYYYVLYASNTVGAAFGTPALSVTASALAPVIDALAPTNLQSTSATMQGDLIASNGAVTSVTLYWGTHDAGASAGGWTHTNSFGVRAEGMLTTNITGLAGNTAYWYRWFATNTAGGNWSTGITFTTSHGLLFDTAPTQVQGGTDDGVLTVTLPFDFPFFGIRTNVLRITSNGGYGLSTNASLANITRDSSQSPWYNTGYPVIASLWDDLNTTPGGGTYAGLATLGGVTYSNAYVVTVPGAFSYGIGHTFGNEIQFQVALFSDRTSVALGNGHVFQFEPGDILFWYADNRLVAFEGGSCAVGIGDGTVGAGHYVGMPGTVAGVLSTADRGLLPTTGESFVLFRTTDRAGTEYSASIVSFGPRWFGSVFSFR